MHFHVPEENMTRVVVASRSFSRHPVLRAELLARYPDTTFNDQGLSLAGSDLIDFLSGHDKAVIALERIDAAALDALPTLKVIAKYGVGFDKIDLHAMIERGAQLGWTGGVNRRSVAELVAPDNQARIQRLAHLKQRLLQAMSRQQTPARHDFILLQKRLDHQDPKRRLEQQSQRLDELATRLQQLLRQRSYTRKRVWS